MLHTNNKLAYLLFFLSFFLNSKAQTEKKSTGTAEVEIKNITPEEAQRKAIDKAKINAIDSAFGSFVSSNTSIYNNNNINNEQKSHSQSYEALINVQVKGEWIKDIDVKTEIITKVNALFYKATVTGLVRELKYNESKFKFKTQSCEKENCQTDDFNNNQDFFMYFKTPQKGHIAVYLESPVDKEALRLLPYKNALNQNDFSVDADKDYLFFSKNRCTVSERNFTDEMIFTLSKDNTAETNILYVFFSPEPLEKPNLSDKKNEMPLSLNSSDFKIWFQALRQRNPKIQLATQYILIKPQ